MPTILSLLRSAVLPSLRDRASLQLELIALRHQLAVLERKTDDPVPVDSDRPVLLGLVR